MLDKPIAYYRFTDNVINLRRRFDPAGSDFTSTTCSLRLTTSSLLLTSLWHNTTRKNILWLTVCVYLQTDPPSTMVDADRDLGGASRSGTAATTGTESVVEPDLSANKLLSLGSAEPEGLCGHYYSLSDFTATLVEEAGSEINTAAPPPRNSAAHCRK